MTPFSGPETSVRRWSVCKRLGTWYVLAPDGSIRDCRADWAVAFQIAFAKAGGRR